MAYKIIWSPHATQNLLDIAAFIMRDSINYATIFVQRVIDSIEILSEFPETGRIVPEYQNPNIREKILGNYRIVYRLKGETLEIVTVIHGSRLFMQ